MVRSFLVSLIAIEGLGTLPAKRSAMAKLCAEYCFPFDVKGELGVQLAMTKNHCKYVLQTQHMPRPVLGMRQVRELRAIPVAGIPFHKTVLAARARDAVALLDKADALSLKAHESSSEDEKEALFTKASKARLIAAELQKRIAVMQGSSAYWMASSSFNESLAAIAAEVEI